jgi:hypothetical protein
VDEVQTDCRRQVCRGMHGRKVTPRVPIVRRRNYARRTTPRIGHEALT